MSTLRLFRLCYQRAEPGSQLEESRVSGYFSIPATMALVFQLPIPLVRTMRSREEHVLPAGWLTAELSIAAASMHYLCKTNKYTSGYSHGEAGGSYSFCSAAVWGI